MGLVFLDLSPWESKKHLAQTNELLPSSSVLFDDEMNTKTPTHNILEPAEET